MKWSEFISLNLAFRTTEDYGKRSIRIYRLVDWLSLSGCKVFQIANKRKIPRIQFNKNDYCGFYFESLKLFDFIFLPHWTFHPVTEISPSETGIGSVLFFSWLYIILNRNVMRYLDSATSFIHIKNHQFQSLSSVNVNALCIGIRVRQDAIPWQSCYKHSAPGTQSVYKRTDIQILHACTSTYIYIDILGIAAWTAYRVFSFNTIRPERITQVSYDWAKHLTFFVIWIIGVDCLMWINVFTSTNPTIHPSIWALCLWSKQIAKRW